MPTIGPLPNIELRACTAQGWYSISVKQAEAMSNEYLKDYLLLDPPFSNFGVLLEELECRIDAIELDKFLAEAGEEICNL